MVLLQSRPEGTRGEPVFISEAADKHKRVEKQLTALNAALRASWRLWDKPIRRRRKMSNLGLSLPFGKRGKLLALSLTGVCMFVVDFSELEVGVAVGETIVSGY